jgi:serine/threonine protein kinase
VRYARQVTQRSVEMDYDVDLSDAGILGAGAFADVRRATCRRTGKPVVVKVFRETDAIFADSLQRELDSLDAIRALTEREQREAAAGAAAAVVESAVDAGAGDAGFALDESNRARRGCHDYLAVYGDVDAAVSGDLMGEKEAGGHDTAGYYVDDNNHHHHHHHTSPSGTGGAKNRQGGEPALHLVADLLTGGDLFDFIVDDPVRSPNGRVLEPVAAHIGHQIVEALVHSQRAGWCHLDLKPENVCVVNPSDATSSPPPTSLAVEGGAEEGEEGEGDERVAAAAAAAADGRDDDDDGGGDATPPEVTLIDFGHARPVPSGSCVEDTDGYVSWSASSSSSSSDASATQGAGASGPTAHPVRYPQDAIVGEAGSDSYAAPEVLWQSTFGTTSDTWSFGILMYAMLSGALPWPEGKQRDFLLDQGEIDACLDAHLEHELLRPVIVDLLRACLVVDPQQRARPDQLLVHPVWAELLGDDAQLHDQSGGGRGRAPYPVFWDDHHADGMYEALPDYKQRAGVFQRQDVVKLRGSFMMSKVRRGLKLWGKTFKA